ncbi:pyridoxal phosphate-dependent transferase [Lipomyces oligophaga]|uniref:pyridoxal phosphate-dependent transferase n=1 Tax=Lipomyces oligophaga TaxID=45792 RepID=UPI0034D00814
MRRASRLKMASAYLADPEMKSLAAGLPAAELFPIARLSGSVLMPKSEPERSSGSWKGDGLLTETVMFDKDKQSTQRGSTKYDLSKALQYEQGSGARQLLSFLKEHTKHIHNPKFLDWDCTMSGGNMQAIETIFRMLVTAGDYVIMEEFVFPETADCLRPMRCKPLPIPIDEFGIRVDLLEEVLSSWDFTTRGAKRPTVIYTVPTGQNPTGVTMNVARRRDLYAMACKYDMIIIEDDPYYFLQMPKYQRNRENWISVPKSNKDFLESLVPSMLSFDVEGRVLRLDSCSKVVAPGTRCGWITGSNQFIERILRHNEVSLQAPSGLSMAVLHGLLVDCWGQDNYLNWLVNLRAEYTIRRNAILDAMEDYLPKDIVSWVPPTAGMFVWMELDYEKHPLKEELSIEALEYKIYEESVVNKVLILPGGWFKSSEFSRPRGMYFRATFASVSQDIMRLAIQEFAQIVKVSYKK